MEKQKKDAMFFALAQFWSNTTKANEIIKAN